MNALTIIFAAAVFVAAVLATIAIWAPRNTLSRAAAVGLTIVLMPLIYLGLTEVLSQPKPINHEWFKRNVDEVTVIGADYQEGKAIYLWLKTDASSTPSYYVMPWQQNVAERLENLIDEALRDRLEVKMDNPFSRPSFDDLGDVNIRIVRPPTLPLKLPPPPSELIDPRKNRA